MDTMNYQHSIIVPHSAGEVYEAIPHVAGWWTINIDGHSKTVGDEFTVQFGDVHRTTQRIIEAVQGERIVWRVTESHLPWLKDVEEWKGTEMVFEITSTDKGTLLTFTHVGLTPDVECFDQCEKGWNFFIGTSLFKLITKGTGTPDTTARTHFDIIGHVRPTNA